MGGNGATAWWRAGDSLDRFVRDLLHDEARMLRPTGPWPAATVFGPDAVPGEAGLGFDSLERLAMAAALGEALFLHRGGLGDDLVTGARLGAWHDAAAAALDRCADEVSFRSSGSTGSRRRHVHALALLQDEAAFFATILPGRHRVLAAVPCHHIYGFLFALLLPARLGLPVVALGERAPSAVAAMLRPGDLVIGHPGSWAALCRAAPEGWPADVVGVSSGAPCPDETADAARRAGLARMVQVYGSSETAGIGWRDDPAEPYRLLPRWGATAPDVPDRLRWHAPGLFTPEGRRDEAVQVGGVNVFPGRVRDALLRHPEVADAAVRPMAAHEGDRLKAFVVPRDAGASPAVLAEVLFRFADAALTPPERPRAFRFGPELPRGASGKPADWALQGSAAPSMA